MWMTMRRQRESGGGLGPVPETGEPRASGGQLNMEV